MTLAHRVVVMNEGRIEQIGTPAAIYDNPATPFINEFIGNANRIECMIRGGRLFVGDSLVHSQAGRGLADGPALAYVRPHELGMVAANDGEGLSGTVRYSFTRGSTVHVEVECPALARTLEVEVPAGSPDLALARNGTAVRLQLRKIRVHAPAAPGMAA